MGVPAEGRVGAQGGGHHVLRHQADGLLAAGGDCVGDQGEVRGTGVPLMQQVTNYSALFYLEFFLCVFPEF